MALCSSQYEAEWEIVLVFDWGKILVQCIIFTYHWTSLVSKTSRKIRKRSKKNSIGHNHHNQLTKAKAPFLPCVDSFDMKKLSNQKN